MPAAREAELPLRPAPAAPPARRSLLTTAEPFASEALYELKIDTDGDAVADIAYRVRFSSSKGGAQTATLRRVEGAQARGMSDGGSLILEGAPVSTGREALVTEAGLVRKGNPDRLPSAAATHWASYHVGGIDRLVAGEWDAVHGGYDNTAALQDPNRVVPLDALRELEREGVIGKLLDDVFVTVGNIGSLNAMKRIGAEIAATLVQRGVQGVVLPAT